MDRIKISRQGKEMLFSMKSNKYPSVVPEEDIDTFKVLEMYGLVQGNPCKGERHPDIRLPRLTDEGIAYLTENPSLKNPSIWEDKKYLINTMISIIALVLSFFALIKK